jgi:hypothetical protein
MGEPQLSRVFGGTVMAIAYVDVYQMLHQGKADGPKNIKAMNFDYQWAL